MTANSWGKPAGIGKIALGVNAAIFDNRDDANQCGDRSHTTQLKPLLEPPGRKFWRMTASRESVQTNGVLIV